MTERQAAGLYDPAFERDSCGFGLIANLDDMPSHWVVDTAISALVRLTHRGAVAADGKTGDGCGLLLKFPKAFMRAVGEDLGFSLNARFAAGSVFLHQDEARADAARDVIGTAVREIVTDAEMKHRERANLRAALDETGWKISGPDGAAELLGLRPTTLTSRIKKLGLERGR